MATRRTGASQDGAIEQAESDAQLWSPKWGQRLPWTNQHVKAHSLVSAAYSENVKDIFGRFEFEKQIKNLDADNLLYLVAQRSSASTCTQTSSRTSRWG